MKNTKLINFKFAAFVFCNIIPLQVLYAATDIASEPLYTSRSVLPLNMLVMGRDHKLYYEAYNDASDLDEDGIVDTRFKPSITYYGYYDSDTCYDYTDSIFVPKSHTVEVEKKCTVGAGEWSGNFLNYISTSRIDALRKVLYGGKRSVDDPDKTILERSYTPQDGHSWGKEYTDSATDGYDISAYTPLSMPVSGSRHLFANTNLTTAPDVPLIRVLTNSKYRIWEWVSIESPVAGDKCDGGGGRVTCASTGTVDTSNPNNYGEFTALVERFKDQVVAGPVSRTLIDKRTDGALSLPGGSAVSVNPQENYISVLTGKLNITAAGDYRFAINGDDAVDFKIIGQNADVGWYGGHGSSNLSNLSSDDIKGWANKSPVVNLAVGSYDIVFRHEEVSGGDSYQLAWKLPSTGSNGWEIIPSTKFTNLTLTVLDRKTNSSVLTDYNARVQVCKDGLLEENCTRYSETKSGITVDYYKPEGILQSYGGNPSPKMFFGLMSGSYKNNTRGGVLRRAMSNISDEINQSTGQFTSVNGVIRSIDKLKIVGYNGKQYSNCGLLARAITNDECHMWGNPIGEILYETVRYFSGKGVPTPAFDYTSSTFDDELGLAKATWDNPYTNPAVQSCSVPVATVISDINPSYDSDDLPGSNWSSGLATDAPTAMNVGTLGDTIWQYEIGGNKNIFIGETDGQVTSTPTEKIAKTFKTTRGLAPEEPTKLGSYYAASVAYYGLSNDLNPRETKQQLKTYSIALASPLPEFKIPIAGNIVTLVPFAKSVKYGSDATWNTFAPTNTIVDFYVEEIAPDAKSGTFRVNFEDVEQGNDHDMDAIVRYKYFVNTDNTLTIDMESQYAAGGVVQHMGYVISGTTKDGAYLEVKDVDTTTAGDFLHPLDTLPGKWAGEPRGTDYLGLTATRTFTPSAKPAAILLKDPLWYAAKWGGFSDKNANGRPDLKEEWTSSTATDPNPDNYFLVTNALKLKDQLDTAFSDILRTLSSSSAAAASTGQFVQGKTQVVQARFRTSDWSGELVSFEILQSSAIGNIVWNSSELVPAADARNIQTYDKAASKGVPFTWSGITTDMQNDLILDGASVSIAQDRLSYLRGDQTKEQRFGGSFRDRLNGVIGDITNSDPVYVDNLESRLVEVPVSDLATYSAFRTSINNRPEMVYTGTNGGMLHGVCALNCPSSVDPGEEMVSYVPSAVFPNLYHLTNPSYSHRYYVDGLSSVSDAKLSTGWKTVLLGALGAGGKAIFALDVTNPASFTSNSVLWEFGPENEAADLSIDISESDLGLTIGKPVIARVKSGDKSVAIFSNGYNGSSGRASLFIVDLRTGKLIRRLRVTGSATALAAPALLDADNDGYVDYVYAGDDKGSLWRFDIRSISDASWSVDLGGDPLFTAKNGQPITAAPTVYISEDNKTFVYIGTGRYLGSTDKSDFTKQSFYAVRDNWLSGNTLASPVTVSSLVQQSVMFEQSGATLADGSVTNFAIRVTSANTVDYDSKDGWYIDLAPPSGQKTGERITASPVVRHGRVIFTTLIPPVDSCEFGGSGWLMEMDAVSGARFAESVLDLNNDGNIDGKDFYKYLTTDYSIGGRKFDELIRMPAFVGFGDKEGKYISGSSGSLSKVWEKGGATLPRGRLSWQQLE